MSFHFFQRTQGRAFAGFVTMIAFLAVVSPAASSPTRLDGDEFWWDGFGPPPGQGIYASGGKVMVFCEYANSLIAGGDFNPEGGWAPYIRAWDGSSWTALGSGVNGYVYALCANGSNLFVGGTFTRAGGALAACVARWNGSAWFPLGTGVDGAVDGMTVYGGDIIVAGSFSNAGGIPTPTHIARWDGSNWHAMGSTSAWSEAMTVEVVGGVLYAGTSTGPRRWNGSEWVSFGPAFNGGVYALASYDGALIATGNFYQIGSSSIYFIAKWDGANWTPLGPGLSWFGRSLCALDGDLIVGGSFGSPSPYLARWDGTAWHGLGSGVNYYSWAVHTWGGNLYVGGEFDHAGGKPSWHIARWMGSAADVEILIDAAGDGIQVGMSNPYSVGGQIRVQAREPLRSAIVYDLRGRRVASLTGKGVDPAAGRDSDWSLRWDGRNDGGAAAPAGVYFLAVRTDHGSVSRRIVLIR